MSSNSVLKWGRDIQMTDATEEQILHRRRWVSETLRDAHVRGTYGDTLMEIAAAANLSHKQRDELFRITDLILLAFIHPDDVSVELSEALGVDAQHAAELTQRLEQRVHGRLRPLLEKTYAPPGPVPANSPIYRPCDTGADEMLRSAFDRSVQVIAEIYGSRIIQGQEQPGPVMSGPRHDLQRKFLDIALAEVAYAEALDDEAVVFVRDEEFFDDNGVRRHVYLTIAELDEAAGAIPSGRDHIERALALGEDAETRIRASRLSAAMGDFGTALKHIERCLALRPDHAAVEEARKLREKWRAETRRVRIRHITNVYLMDDDRQYLSEDDLGSIADVILMETDRRVRAAALTVKGPLHDYAEVMLFDTETITKDIRAVIASVFIHQASPGVWRPGLRPSRPEFAVHTADAPPSEPRYYVHTRRDDTTYGPITTVMISQWLQAHCLLPSDMVCRVGATTWSPIEHFRFT